MRQKEVGDEAFAGIRRGFVELRSIGIALTCVEGELAALGKPYGAVCTKLEAVGSQGIVSR